MSKKKRVETSVTDHLEDILKMVSEASGYPYPEDSQIPAAKAFAYGLAMGSLMRTIEEWKDQGEPHHPGAARSGS